MNVNLQATCIEVAPQFPTPESTEPSHAVVRFSISAAVGGECSSGDVFNVIVPSAMIPQLAEGQQFSMNLDSQ